jgi:ribonuclease-3
LDDLRYKRVQVLEETLEYKFQNRDLIMRALRHRSYGDGHSRAVSNERLEFLGDRVLGLLTAQALFVHSKEAEGTLARRLNALVRKEMCAKIARKIRLGDCLLMSASEEKQGGREKMSILGDACEALIAALYLDGGLETVQDFFDTYWQPELAKVSAKSAKDPKTLLQEMAMSKGRNLPDYQVTDRQGPDHDPVFVVTVTVKNLGSGEGRGKSKRDAEREAAQALIDSWT